MELPDKYPSDVREFFRRYSDYRIRFEPFEKVNEYNIHHATGLPFLRLPFSAPYKTIASEVTRLYSHFTVFEPRKASHYVGLRKPVYELRDDASGWKALTLHGLGPEKSGHHSNYGYAEDLPESEVPYEWTEAAGWAPKTTSWIRETFPVRKFHRVRLMLLEPGRCVFPHKGKLNSNGRCEMGPVNIAIINPENFYFLVKGAGMIPFRPGSCFWFAPGFEHSLVNLSAIPRLHMIIEADFDDEFFLMALKSYEKDLTRGKMRRKVLEKIRLWT